MKGLGLPTEGEAISTKAKNDKYHRILEAAVTVFAQSGFHESTISQIARAAGVADGTIYLYFKNKDDLLISLFETKMDEILKRFAVIKGKDITPLPPYRIVRMGVSRTFQMVRPFYQLPAFKNMIIPLYSPRVKKLVGGKFGDRNAVALDLLEEVGFERDAFVAYKPAGALPQGYLKRLELAKAIALQPDLVILDELFSGLSLAEVAGIVPIIEKLRLQGKTIIMIEHRLKELFRIADRVMVMNFGEKIADGQPMEVMAQDAVKNAYLGTE